MANNTSGANLDQIYNQLNDIPIYTPGEANTFADWSLEAGDLITMTRDGKTYNMPVNNSTLVWKGQPEISVSSEGNQERGSVAKQSRQKYGRSGAGIRNGQGLYSDIWSEDGYLHSYINQTVSGIQMYVEEVYDQMRSGLDLTSSSASLYVDSKYAQMQSGLYLTSSTANLYVDSKYSQMQAGLALTSSSANLYVDSKYVQMQSGLALTSSTASLYVDSKYDQMKSGLDLTFSGVSLYVDSKYDQMKSGLDLTSSTASLYVDSKYDQMKAGIDLTSSTVSMYVNSKYDQMKSGLDLTSSTASLYVDSKYDQMKAGIDLTSSTASMYVNSKYDQMKSGLDLTSSTASLYVNSKYDQMKAGIDLTSSTASMYVNSKYDQMKSGLNLTSSSASLYVNSKYDQMKSGLNLTSSSASLYVNSKYDQMKSGLNLTSSSVHLYVDNKYDNMKAGLKLSESSSMLYARSAEAAAEIAARINESTGESEIHLDANKVYIGNTKSTTVINGKLEASDITADLIASKVAEIPLLHGMSASFSGSVRVGSTIYLGSDTTDVSKNLATSIKELQITQSGNEYKLQKKSFNDSSWVDVGTFRHATVLSGVWGGGILTLRDGPQGAVLKTVGIFDLTSGDVEWVGDQGTIKVYANFDGLETKYDTGKRLHVTAPGGSGQVALTGAWGSRRFLVTETNSGETISGWLYSTITRVDNTIQKSGKNVSQEFIVYDDPTGSDESHGSVEVLHKRLSINASDVYDDGYADAKLVGTWGQGNESNKVIISKSTSGQLSLTYTIKAGASISYDTTTHRYTATGTALVAEGTGGDVQKDSKTALGGTEAYTDGWYVAYGKVAIPGSNTESAEMTVKTPGSTNGTQSTYNYTVSCDNNYGYIKNGVGTTVARVSNSAYGNGWDAAYGKVVIPGSNTESAEMTVKTPGSTSGTQSTYNYTVSCDNNYGYIKNGVGTTVARVSNAAYGNGWETAAGLVVMPAAGTGDSFIVKVPEKVNGAYQQVSKTFTITKGATPGTSGYASVSISGTVVGRISIANWYTTGWETAAGLVVMPAAGTGDSFIVKVPEKVNGAYQQVSKTFTITKGATPGTSGYASVSISGTVVGRISIANWYTTGWETAAGLVVMPSSGTNTSFVVKVPEKVNNEYKQVEKTFTITKGDTPGTSGYASVSISGTVVGRISIANWYTTGWETAAGLVVMPSSGTNTSFVVKVPEKVNNEYKQVEKTFTITKGDTPGTSGYASVSISGTVVGRISIANWYTTGWETAAGLVVMPAAGTSTSFTVKVPEKVNNEYKQVSKTFSITKGDTPGTSGYAAVSISGTVVGRISIANWYTTGWETAAGLVVMPAAGTSTSFTVKVPEKVNNEYKQVSKTFSITKGDTPGTSGYAAVSISGTVVGRISIGDWYTAGRDAVTVDEFSWSTATVGTSDTVTTNKLTAKASNNATKDLNLGIYLGAITTNRTLPVYVSHGNSGGHKALQRFIDIGSYEQAARDAVNFNDFTWTSPDAPAEWGTLTTNRIVAHIDNDKSKQSAQLGLYTTSLTTDERRMMVYMASGNSSGHRYLQRVINIGSYEQVAYSKGETAGANGVTIDSFTVTEIGDNDEVSGPKFTAVASNGATKQGTLNLSRGTFKPDGTSTTCVRLKLGTKVIGRISTKAHYNSGWTAARTSTGDFPITAASGSSIKVYRPSSTVGGNPEEYQYSIVANVNEASIQYNGVKVAKITPSRTRITLKRGDAVPGATGVYTWTCQLSTNATSTKKEVYVYYSTL